MNHFLSKLLVAFLVVSFLRIAPIEAAELYREPWRPQFHFTPERNWINDPNGMVFYDGEYHLFYQHNPFGDKWGHMSWGHAVSRDLFHWEELPIALAEENGVMIFSGSAVVDWKNSSGFGKDGKPPLIANYTGHYTEKPLQNQHIAYSNDRGRTWTKYSGNPVLDIGEKDFRDPKVFWHEPTQRWVMAVAWPIQHKIRFYASKNFKQWTHLSDFGPAGASKEIWECPDLFPLAVEGKREKKWVLIVNTFGAPAGGSGCQYFVGDFDGTRFTLDPISSRTTTDSIPEGRVLADFDGADYGAWRTTGNAFGATPAQGTLPNQQQVGGFRGKGFVNTYLGGDQPHGTLTSPEFKISHDHISFLISGGNHPEKTCVNLLVDSKIVRTATGNDSESLNWKSWNVRDQKGKQAVIEIVDRESGSWGHINVDHILLADKPAQPASDGALWADYGPDFYAAVSWSDIPARDGRRLWLGWMSNWQYANDIPTSPWRNAMSLPRELTLRTTPKGFQLVQHPARESQKLRGKHFRLKNSTASEANDWIHQKQITGNQLEIEVEFEGVHESEFGLKILQGTNEATVIRCDPARQSFSLDRAQSGKTNFHSRFAGIYGAPLRVSNGRVRLHILVDVSSVEVFANNGETVLTALVLPGATSRGLEFLATSETPKIKLVDIWKVRSAMPPSK